MRNTTLRDRYRRSIARDKPPCHICNEDIDYDAHHLDPMSFTIDHIHPLSLGGPDVLDNIAAAHRKCNRDKGNTVLMPDGGPLFVTERTW